MKSAVTISLVPEARSGPFVFHGDFAAGCALATDLGFDAVEIFPPSAEAVNVTEIRNLLNAHRLKLAALGSGAGWVKHKLRLTDPDAAVRKKAREFIGGIIDVAGELGAPVIIGSMQGRCEAGIERMQVLAWLAEGLEELGALAARYNQPLLYEPLNRYETDIFNRQGDAAKFLRALSAKNVRLLCDLFHMNIEETSPADALIEVGPLVGHVHWADSNRHAMGLGHTDAAAIVAALGKIGYTGYLSAEVFPLPDSVSAARQSVENIHRWTSS